MTSRRFPFMSYAAVRVIARGVLPLLVASWAMSASAADSPNIVIVFTDDQGYADVGVFGATGYKTPNIDRMAAEGRKFTSFYVAQAVCSASRAALLTGCYPNRIGIQGALGPRSTHGIHDDEMTIAELVKQRGYATAAYGKWHLGHYPQYLPLQHGFDDYYGLPYSNDMWPYHPAYVDLPADSPKRKNAFPDLPMISGNEIVNPRVTPQDQTKLTSSYTEHAVKFIDDHRDGPFLLYLAHSMPHVPLYTSEDFVGRTEQGRYGDVIEEIDWSVGRILERLRHHGIDEQTWVIFTSDNGPWLSYGNHAGSAAPLREGKGTTWEGGVRVPCVMRWPGHIPAGTVCEQPAATIDILPTVAAVIDADLPQHAIDGMDISPLVFEAADQPVRETYYYYWGAHLQAIRHGDWKLHFPHAYRSLTGTAGRDGVPDGYTQGRTETALYNLRDDIGETTDVQAEHPEVVRQLQELAEQARAELGDSATKASGSGVRPAGKLR